MNSRIVERPLPNPMPTALSGLHPVLARVLAGRGVFDPLEVDHRLSRLLAPTQLSGLDAACALLMDALDQQHRILVVGDFDCDGATGTAVLMRGLRLLGFQRIANRVPNRQIHGYGLTPALVNEINPDYADLLITVDNGIASLAGVREAHAKGFKVLITDHHLPGPQLPEADAIVNPNVNGDGFPSKALAGVGVAFYLLLALRARWRERGRYASAREPDLSSLLDLVALGTVADMVPLDFNNRCLVEAGLRRMRAGQACAGIRALLRVGGRREAIVSTTDLGFIVGPRVNAAGRLDDMQVGIDCLLTDDTHTAESLARQLDAINAERREMQSDMAFDAHAIVEQMGVISGSIPAGLCLAQAHWHAGVIGLVASKLKEHWHRPAIALAPANEDAIEWRGSARSVKGFHIRDALAEIDANHPGLMIRFGGHAMAAGLSVAAENIPALQAAFDAITRKHLGDHPEIEPFWCDGALPGRDLSLSLAEQLRDLAPWGQHFPEPQFCNAFQVESVSVMAVKHLRMNLRFIECGTPIEAVFFGGAETLIPKPELRAVWQVGIDEWRGEKRLRAMIRHVESCP